MSTSTPSLHFIEQIIKDDLHAGRIQKVHTRFPPEPNGFLHLGHAKAICLNFAMAKKYGGTTNLRFDDTNPTTEETRYVDAIKDDIKWLGFMWEKETYSSDYFDTLYDWACELIKCELAYVDDSSFDEIQQMRGDLTHAGKESKYRSRSAAENLQLFDAMRAGKFADGACVLRAKIDMASPNVHLRDPIMYRIKHARHHRTGDKWCIYPSYDYAHGQGDAIERITHSLCSLEYVPHRPLYDWFIEKLNLFPSHQYEFARLNLTHTMMSKRKLLTLVQDGFVASWDDPRMPTIAGVRRRGYTAQAIRDFCERIGVAKRDNLIEWELLEHFVRADLNKNALRIMAVLDPIKLIITNYPTYKAETLRAENNPEDAQAGVRELSFSHELWIEREDFMENPDKHFHRLSPMMPVRLKYAYIVRYEDCVKNEAGDIMEIHCSYVENSRSGEDTSGVKVKATLHWVDAKNCVQAQVRKYDKLFLEANPSADVRALEEIVNPDSLHVIEDAKIERSIEKDYAHATHFQFLRKGYFYRDKVAETKDAPLVFNSTVGLKDSFGKTKK